MIGAQLNKIQNSFGGKIACDGYPYPTPDRDLWLCLLTMSATKSIGLYGELMKIRAIGAKLEPNDKFGYVIKPLIRGRDECKWGWPSEDAYTKEKDALKPYIKVLGGLLKELRNA